MLAKIFTLLIRIFPGLKSSMWKLWYQYLAKSYPKKEWTFMNYGFAFNNSTGEELKFGHADPDNKYCAQLYQHIVNTISLKDLNVLEVGSGRGGGAEFINRSFKPTKMVGVDFSENAVNFCKKVHPINGLSFEVGNAESLPFDDCIFDAVLNVESSHCYSSIVAFLSEVKRVLRTGGYFLFADFRSKEDLIELKKTLHNSGLTTLKEMNITKNIVAALDFDSDRKSDLIKKIFPQFLIKPFIQFSGTVGSKIYNDFKSENTVYYSFVLQKKTK